MSRSKLERLKEIISALGAGVSLLFALWILTGEETALRLIGYPKGAYRFLSGAFFISLGISLIYFSYRFSDDESFLGKIASVLKDVLFT